jgi:hypothetical protein
MTETVEQNEENNETEAQGTENLPLEAHEDLQVEQSELVQDHQ